MGTIFKSGGGVGVNISTLRPNGAKTRNAAKTSSGSISFMEIFDSVGKVVGVNNRRSALMIGLNCDHPDLYEFLQVKQNNDAVQSANTSILFTDKFMEAVKAETDFGLSFEVEPTGEIIEKTINANNFFVEFAEANHNYAEPGAIFIDNVRKYNLLSGYPESEYKIDISNPCAEYFGSAGNACTLGSINLYNIVDNPFTKEATINFPKLSDMVALGVESLDEILDIGYNSQPLGENCRAIDDWRAIGLGVFGLADMLIALGVQYGSKDSIAVIEEVISHIWFEALCASNLLAKNKGTFGKYNWNYIKESPLISAKLVGIDVYRMIKKHGLRNGSLISIAPTGSIATQCGISGGCEPLFAISYERTTHALSDKKQYFKVYAKSVEHLLKHNNIDPDSITTEEIKKRFPFVVASHDISPKDRVDVQATMQKWVDNAISSTINLNHNTSVQEVFNTYMYAWENGCKGITVFRDGCERSAILTTKPQSNDLDHKADLSEYALRALNGKNVIPNKIPLSEEKSIMFNSITPIKRTTIGKVYGSTVRKVTACVPSMYVTVNKQDGDILEVFTNVSQGCTSNISSITRLASLALRSGVKVDELVKEMRSNHCQACSVLKSRGQQVSNSCSYAIAEAIEAAYNDNDAEIVCSDSADSTCSGNCYEYSINKYPPDNPKPFTGMLSCPNCGEKTLRPEGRCYTCSNCLYSKCE